MTFPDFWIFLFFLVLFLLIGLRIMSYLQQIAGLLAEQNIRERKREQAGRPGGGL